MPKPPPLLIENLGLKLAACVQSAPTALTVHVDGDTIWVATWGPEGLRVISGPRPGPTVEDLAAVEPIALAVLPSEWAVFIEDGIERHALTKSERIAGWFGLQELVA